MWWVGNRSREKSFQALNGYLAIGTSPPQWKLVFPTEPNPRKQREENFFVSSTVLISPLHYSRLYSSKQEVHIIFH